MKPHNVGLAMIFAFALGLFTCLLLEKAPNTTPQESRSFDGGAKTIISNNR